METGFSGQKRGEGGETGFSGSPVPEAESGAAEEEPRRGCSAMVEDEVESKAWVSGNAPEVMLESNERKFQICIESLSFHSFATDLGLLACGIKIRRKDQNLNEAKEDQPTQQCHSDHTDSELYKAAVEGNLEILRENKDQLNLQLTPNKNIVLHIAALFGQTECVEEILKMNSSLLCQMNVKGDTALHLAAREGQQDSVDALIKHANKLDEDSVELESGSTMTKKMLRARNEDGDTALHDTVRLYSHQFKLPIRLLTEDKEYTYTANNAGETPLYIAAERRHHEVVSQILETCTAPAYDGPGGRTALHAVVISNDEGKLVLINFTNI
ncbi:Ankyrin repeat-containing protein [Camellia lanceoleosa]|uniref:Ankyrin repeat-containing protein n=1 Tax=Camellia lanceoleosa TaxID=1840588 RepID=A0ACC0HFX4_9ERIC|nr:Ankyrin repeat-containing protein [Camellia lanceoleosa]